MQQSMKSSHNGALLGIIYQVAIVLSLGVALAIALNLLNAAPLAPDTSRYSSYETSRSTFTSMSVYLGATLAAVVIVPLALAISLERALANYDGRQPLSALASVGNPIQMGLAALGIVWFGIQCMVAVGSSSGLINAHGSSGFFLVFGMILPFPLCVAGLIGSIITQVSLNQIRRHFAPPVPPFVPAYPGQPLPATPMNVPPVVHYQPQPPVHPAPPVHPQE